MKRLSSFVLGGVLCATVSMISVRLWDTAGRADSHTPRDHLSQLVQTGARSSDSVTPGRAELYGVHIRKPEHPKLLELSGVDPQGRPVKVACSTCHSVRPADLQTRSSEALNEFHQGLAFRHGNLACYACHDPTDSDSLRLADGSGVPFSEVMQLCSQCHSAQAVAFEHGAHGGMTGFWDRTRGPQQKNNCIDCHDPHAPSYPKMIVGFKPRDRFLETESDHDDHE